MGEFNIHYLAREGDIKKLRKAIRKHPDQLNVQDLRGWTPLHEAVAWGQKESIQLLIEEGTNSYIVDNNGRSPFMVAVEAGDIDIIEAIIKHRKFDVNHDYISNCEAALANAMRSTLIDMLFENGLDPDYADGEGSMLHRLLYYIFTVEGIHYVDIFNNYIDRGVDVNVVNDMEETALHLWAQATVSCSRRNTDDEMREYILSTGCRMIMAGASLETPNRVST
jgi:ankyrin repeat protein